MNKISLSLRISLLFAGLLFAVVGIFTIVLYCYFQKTVDRSITGAVRSTVNANTDALCSLIERMEITVRLVHNNESVYQDESSDRTTLCSLIVSYEQEESGDNLIALRRDYTAALSRFNDFFKTCFGKEQGSFSNVLFADKTWPVHVFMPKVRDFFGKNGFGDGLSAEQEEWYRYAYEQGGEICWFVREEYPEYLCMAKRLNYRWMEKNKLQERVLGVLVLCFDMEAISNYLDTDGLTPGSHVYLTDQEGKVIYSTDREWKNDAFMDEIPDLEDGIFQNLTCERKEYYAHCRYLPLGLKVYTMVPVEDIRHMTSETIQIIGLMGILMIGIAAVVTIFLSITVAAPLRRFAAYMNAGNTGKIACPEDRCDELGILYKAFNHLMQRLEEAAKSNLEAVEKEKQAQLHALQAQINPHFVYNTLNSIACLALLREQTDIADMLADLTKIMRYHVSNPDAPVTVAEELEMIRKYEAIQKQCYRDSISFAYKVEEEAKNVMIPKLIIQPLVENALIHGMNLEENNGQVRIEVYKKDFLFIRVWDNGQGAEVERINKYLLGEESMPRTGDSLGIRNVAERIRMYFGPEATLCYEKDEEGCTLAVLKVENRT